ncbi:peptidyl-prolyl cis-trans isomerase, EpsD family [Nitrogeniibacter mangrovi]|uniref:Peptidyl-prolyl cis-trans isomerase, EpsD family n=1 Tax=Nitrogeniibacter mangrovi TaxID=2016596 RepID=A0A6C1B353_9RHOO|nr:EpsD family peptidyl-prolyl cis-trans isomerase [Nitrogeniibacter mangrovi]QID16760.1 peptidyl-prolyl cis-trans isomerase, EpsD family [Nitrogeniibacter mangrovi]
MTDSGFIFRLASTVALSLTLAACGSGSDSKGATQVAAKVNSGEITVHQVNAMLARTPNIKPDQVEKATELALSRLVDQELLVQRAKEKKLDRDPRVLQAIEAAQRDILARSYMEQYTATADKPTATEMRSFFDANPALFAERRIYNLQELNITLEPGQMDDLRKTVSEAKSLNEIVSWLREHNIQFKAGGGVRAAEQLPMEALPRFAKMKDGQIGLVQTRTGVLAIYLAGSRPAPLDFDKATPFIERFLLNRKRAEMAQAEMKRLRDTAQIAYMGNFKAAEVAPAESHAAALATESGGSAVSAAGAVDAEAMQKGLSGLK